MIILGILAFICIIFIIIMIIDCHRLVVRNYEIRNNKISNELNIIFLTDLHGVSFGKNNKRLIEKIDNLKPDIIAIAGDMYTAYKNNDTTVPRKLLKDLSSKYPVYYANGNHELKTKVSPLEFGPIYSEYIEDVKSNGTYIINNEKIYLSDYNVLICGLDLPFDYYKKGIKINPTVEELDELLGEPNKQVMNVLLAHNPEYFKDYSKWGADLTLSGHYHGGLMRLPLIGGFISPRYTLFPKYDYGVFEDNDNKMILSCGLGTHTLPIRIFNPGEISYIHLKK